jgi:hypothetical protein
MHWHNEIGELLKELHTSKHDLYRLLRNYL